MPSVADFFDRHLTALVNQPLLEGYETYDMDCEIDFRDRDERWRIDIAGGRICGVRKCGGEESKARIQYDVDEPVFWDIVQRRLSPQKAFFLRRTNIKGDFFQGMKLAKILGLFFEKIPYQDPIRMLRQVQFSEISFSKNEKTDFAL